MTDLVADPKRDLPLRQAAVGALTKSKPGSQALLDLAKKKQLSADVTPLAASLLHNAGIEPIVQLACRDRNRIALQGDLMGAAALGLRNLLLLRGDDPTAGDQKDAKPVFDLDSRALMETARAMRDEGRLPHGPKVAGAPRFFLGAFSCNFFGDTTSFVFSTLAHFELCLVSLLLRSSALSFFLCQPTRFFFRAETCFLFHTFARQFRCRSLTCQIFSGPAQSFRL